MKKRENKIINNSKPINIEAAKIVFYQLFDIYFEEPNPEVSMFEINRFPMEMHDTYHGSKFEPAIVYYRNDDKEYFKYAFYDLETKCYYEGYLDEDENIKSVSEDYIPEHLVADKDYLSKWIKMAFFLSHITFYDLSDSDDEGSDDEEV